MSEESGGWAATAKLWRRQEDLAREVELSGECEYWEVQWREEGGGWRESVDVTESHPPPWSLQPAACSLEPIYCWWLVVAEWLAYYGVRGWQMADGCRSDCVPAPSPVSPPDTAPWERTANMLGRATDLSQTDRQTNIGSKSAAFREYSSCLPSVGGGVREYCIISVLSVTHTHSHSHTVTVSQSQCQLFHLSDDWRQYPGLNTELQWASEADTETEIMFIISPVVGLGGLGGLVAHLAGLGLSPSSLRR